LFEGRIVASFDNHDSEADRNAVGLAMAGTQVAAKSGAGKIAGRGRAYRPSL
jgi:hypothetical protein